MKKTNKILYSLIILLVFISAVFFASKIFMENRYLNEREVKEIVFRNSNSFEKDVSEYKCITEVSDDGKLVYDVSFTDSKGVYKFILECETGKIIEFTELLNTGSVSETEIP